MTERRRFNTSERVAAYLIAGGHCEDCGVELEPGWPGDHYIPYSFGGATDVTNIQALCPKCNWRKGNKMPFKKPAVEPFYDRENPDRTPRQWQDEWFDVFVQKMEKEKWMLLVACPAAGKTVAALRAVHAKLESDAIDMIIVITHSRRLCKQWIKKAAAHGIELREFNNGDGRPSRGFHGIAVTYQQISRQPDIFAKMCRECRVGVIPDEGHHSGESKTWGIALREAFERNAELVLTLSGTPFRGDQSKIPFVQYDDDGVCVPTHQYSYTQSITDGVCRKVEFPYWNAVVKWHVAHDGDDRLESHEIDFDADVSEYERATRLREALLDENYVSAMVRSADSLLRDLRQDDPRAGGIIFAMTSQDNDEDDRHAKFIGRIVHKVTGYKPRIVTYDNDKALSDIDAFEKSDEPWVVCIKMISEGVDIPRLRVGVHATNYIAPLFFKQAVGRILRQQISPTRDEDGNIVEDDKYLDDYAYYLIPKDPLLVQNAQEMEAEVLKAVAEIKEKKRREGGDPPTSTRTIIREGTENERADGSWYRKAAYDQSPLDVAATAIKTTGMKCTPAQLLAAYEIMDGQRQQSQQSTRQEPSRDREPVVPKDVRVTAARKRLSSEVRGLAFARGKVTGTVPEFGATTDELNAYLGDLVGKKYLSFREADEPELIKGLSWVKQQLAKLAK